MTIEECIRKGLLRRARVSPDVIRIELSLAQSNLEEARSLNRLNHPNAAVIFIYTSMFHSARSLLYKDGYTERSHACLILYLIENYVRRGKVEARFVNVLDSLKSERHQTLYGTPKAYKMEAVNELIDTADEFLNSVRELSSKKNGCAPIR